ncbi:MAG: DUF296 domain-containing protein [Gemmatimonadetes bacterium]|nr:DUF296 domain-containing protein [Gemmatimonadota bacterium]
MAHAWHDGSLHIFRLDCGEAFPGALFPLLAAEDIPGGLLSGIGAFERATVAYFDTATNRYLDIAVAEQVEVITLTGNLAQLENGEPFIHAHVALSRRDGGVVAGHLREGIVNPTLEVFLHATRRPLRRVIDPASGLGRLDLRDSG